MFKYVKGIFFRFYIKRLLNCQGMQIIYKARRLLKSYDYKVEPRETEPKMSYVRIGKSPRIFFNTPF